MTRIERALFVMGLITCVSTVATYAVKDAHAQVRVASVKQKLEPLADFRRIEILVSEDFSSSCRKRGKIVACSASKLPARFAELMVGLRGGGMAAVEVRRKTRGRVEIRFELRRKSLKLQQVVLPRPSRWVIEIGIPKVLIGPVAEQQPFRPYPVPPTNISSRIPPPNIFKLNPEKDENRVVNLCFDLWQQQKPLEALEACNEVVTVAPKSSGAIMAKKISAEAWMGFVDPKSTDKLPDIVKAIQTAENAVTRPEEGARYALLLAQVFEAVGYLNRSEMHLANSTERYEKTTALSYLLAGHARILMRIGEGDAARKILEKLRGLRSDSPTIGSALLALAQLAYHEKNHVVSIGLFDVVRTRWPELLHANSTALFQAGELYMLFARVADAKNAYERFTQSKIRTVPDWLAQLRLIEIQSYSDPQGARKKFRDLASSLGKAEGQDLAFLRFARLEAKASDRRRIISNLGAAPTTPYVFEDLTVQSIQQALDDGNLDDAYRYAMTFWREIPEAFVLKKGAQLFDRVLMLKLVKLAEAEDHLGVIGLYYSDRNRFEGHATRGEVHLMVSESLRSLAMLDEARLVLQKGVGGRTAEREPDVTARLYRSLAAVLWENGDKYRLGEILDYLDSRYPKRFDDYDYWMARAHRAWWDGKLKETRKMLVYALNGPVSMDQRLSILDLLTQLYVEMDKVERAVKALNTYVQLHDKMGRPRGSKARRDARWRVAEVYIEKQKWPKALVASMRFLEEYPDDPIRMEARFFSARALQAIGDTESAKRQLDIVAKEDPKGLFGKLAVLELQMLKWRTQKLQPAMSRANL
jgi:tetratricopeptide (TPR) repeat protein